MIPSHCLIRASVRTPSLDVWEALPEVMSECLADLLVGTGAEHVIDYTHGVPPVINDPAVIAVAEAAVKNELGENAVAQAVQSWGGDDFSWFTRARPAAYLRLGVHNPDGDGPMLDLHAGHFDVDERSIAVGVRLLTSVTASYFGSSTSG